MKSFGIGLFVALAAVSWANAYEFQDTAQWSPPKYERLKAKWPHDAVGGLIYGKVLLDCGVGANGFATDCRVKASEPSNPTLEQAALGLAPLYKIIDPKMSRAMLEVDVRYDEPADWLKRPSLDDMMAVYPGPAFRQGVSGKAIIKCTVQISGLVRACSVISEDRPGLGFGPAAVVLARTFLFKPALRGGQPVEADVSFPVNFVTDGNPEDEEETTSGRIRRAPPPSPPTMVLGEAVWSKTPTVADILGEINKKVGDKFAQGQVVFQCRLDKKSGKLNGCVVANVSPGMVQFKDVAKSLVPKFQANPDVLASAKGDVLVNLAFAFPDMSSPEWGKRYLTHPRWIRALGPDSKISTFPEAATKVGLKRGSATVDCVVAPDGALTHCETIRESSPNVGFGETAIQIAQTFAANPWDEDGLPVDGAHVRMPIQMDYQPLADSPAANAPPSAPPTPATKP
jgi:TonB family protein